MRVGTNQETTRESVVLEKNLMNDSRARSPETNVVLGTRCSKEIVDLLVDIHSSCKILRATDLSLNQMITVDGSGIGDGGHACGHELEDCHLCSRVLTSYSVGSELEVRDTTLDLLSVGIVQMGIEDLLSIGERAIESGANNGQVLGHLLVIDEVALLLVVLADFLVQRRIRDRSHSAEAQLGSTATLSSD